GNLADRLENRLRTARVEAKPADEAEEARRPAASSAEPAAAERRLAPPVGAADPEERPRITGFPSRAERMLRRALEAPNCDSTATGPGREGPTRTMRPRLLPMLAGAAALLLCAKLADIWFAVGPVSSARAEATPAKAEHSPAKDSPAKSEPARSAEG